MTELENMIHETDGYTYRVTWSKEDGEFVGLCAEFLSLSWLSSSSEAAMRGIRELVKNSVADTEVGPVLSDRIDS